MANSTATTGTSISALVKEGKALGSIWRQVNSLKQTIKENGFDTRLGKLLQELKAQSTVDSTQTCLLYTSPSPRDGLLSRMPSSA